MNRPWQRQALRLMFLLAAIYNLCWGIVFIAEPQLLFDFLGISPARYPFLMSGIGLFVALYAYGYYVVSQNLHDYPAIVLIGLLGKTLGPIGWALHVHSGALPLASMIVNITNDLIWVPGFVYYFFWRSRERIGASIYESALPETSMHTILREFHRARKAGASGRVNVTGNKNCLMRLFARLGGLPQPGRDLPVHLIVEHNGHHETWRRIIGDTRLVSRQWIESSRIVERFGSIEAVFDLEATASGGYRFVQVATRLFAFPLPRVLGPSISAIVRPRAGGWLLRVSIRQRFTGLLARYVGYVEVEAC